MKLSSTSYVCLVSCVLGRYMMPTISSMPSDNSVVPFIFIISCLASSLFLRLKINIVIMDCIEFHTVHFLTIKRLMFGFQQSSIQEELKKYIILTLPDVLPSVVAWFSGLCLPFCSLAALWLWAAVPLQWPHLWASGQSKIDPLVIRDWSSTRKYDLCVLVHKATC